MNKATIRLFKAVLVKTKKKKKVSRELLGKTIRKGFIFAQEVIANYPEKELIKLIKVIEEEFGLTAEQMNSSFHKCWKKVKEADMEQLVVEQLAHYLTTYGKEQPKEYLIEKEEQWGVDNLAEKIIELPDFKSDKIKDENYVYIPKEKLEIPDLDIDGIRLVVIRGYTKEELKEKLLKLLSSGIALGEETIKDVVELAVFLKIDEDNIDGIRNKEVKTALYDKLGMFPENPIEFLRYAVFKSIGKTLLIKDKATIEGIKSKDNLDVLELFVKYKKKYGLERLAEIFNRYKPLFLAFRTHKQMKAITNKIRKLAKKHHKPMKEDYLNDITAKIKKGENIDLDKLSDEINKVNVFRKIRLLYALKFRAQGIDSIMYKIRSGKSYATETEGYNTQQKNNAKRVFDIVLGSITKDIRPNVKGKKVYIPEYITYALPATEKQFTGDFPSGTYVSIPKDMVVGVCWDNVEHNRIDLDLSMVNANGKIGWDADYRTEGGDILFSGDMTDASKGASELFYVRRQSAGSHILVVNYYNYVKEVEVPLKIVVAREQVKNLSQNYMVNPNNVVSIAKTKINQKQKILGLMVTTATECRFYFAETYLGASITSSNSEFVENSRKYLFEFYRNTISLNEVLKEAGAKIVNDKEKCDIDLSPETLEKDRIIRLISGG